MWSCHVDRHLCAWMCFQVVLPVALPNLLCCSDLAKTYIWAVARTSLKSRWVSKHSWVFIHVQCNVNVSVGMCTLYYGHVVKLNFDRYCITGNCVCPTYPVVCVHVQLCVLGFALDLGILPTWRSATLCLLPTMSKHSMVSVHCFFFTDKCIFRVCTLTPWYSLVFVSMLHCRLRGVEHPRSPWIRANSAQC